MSYRKGRATHIMTAERCLLEEAQGIQQDRGRAMWEGDDQEQRIMASTCGNIVVKSVVS